MLGLCVTAVSNHEYIWTCFVMYQIIFTDPLAFPKITNKNSSGFTPPFCKNKPWNRIFWRSRRKKREIGGKTFSVNTKKCKKESVSACLKSFFSLYLFSLFYRFTRTNFRLLCLLSRKQEEEETCVSGQLLQNGGTLVSWQKHLPIKEFCNLKL